MSATTRAPRLLTLLLALMLAAAGALVPGTSLAAAAPQVTGVSPGTGPTVGGNYVLLHGSGFTGATAVRFGGATSRTIEVGTDAEMVAKAPPHGAGRVHVSVVTPSGTSAFVAVDVYQYVADPRPLVRSGTARTTPPVTFDRTGKVVLSCTAATFCVAGGSRGVSTFRGSTWGAVTSLGDRRVRSVSCTSPTFCMAGTYGGALWRYDGTTWTRTASPYTTSVEALSCSSPTLCVTAASTDVAGRLVAVWDGQSWTTRSSAATGVSCPTPTACVVTDENYFQVYSGGQWGPERLLYRSALYESYAGGGALSCTSLTFCVDGDGGSGGDFGRPGDYTVLNGADETWSNGLALARTNVPSRVASLVECQSTTFCVLRQGSFDTGSPPEARTQVRWWAVSGAARTPFSASYDATVSCWAPYACVLMSPRSFFLTRRG